MIHKIISFHAVVAFQFYSDCLWPCCVVSLTLVLESLLFGLLVRLTSLTMTPLSPSLLSLLDISMSVISSLISTTLKLKKRKINLLNKIFVKSHEFTEKSCWISMIHISHFITNVNLSLKVEIIKKNTDKYLA